MTDRNAQARPASSTDHAFRRGTKESRLKERYRQRFEGIEAAINDAIDSGAFDNLPGKGQPINWQGNHDDENWLANHMLKNAGYKPAWIEDAKRIQAQRESLENLLEMQMRWRLELEPDRIPIDDIHRRFSQTVRRYREDAAALNSLIDRFNLSVPLESAQERRVAIENRLAKFEQRFLTR